MRASVHEILSRNESLGIAPITFDAFDHPEHDPGVLLRGHLLLRPFQNNYRYALALFDREGCGRQQPGSELAASVQNNLDENGWRGRSAVLVLEPELEIWVWASSPHVAQALGWRRSRALRLWLEQKEFLDPGQSKPRRPKEAMEAALQEVRQPKSTATYRSIARRVSLAQCTDPTFTQLVSTLRAWFPRSKLNSPRG